MQQRYEYKVVPAPAKGQRVRGVKGTPARFATALAAVMNDLAREGWEYLRADTLPCEERSGLTGRTTTFQNMLVFRRAVPGALPILDESTVAPLVAQTAPAARTPDPAPTDEPEPQAPPERQGDGGPDGTEEVPGVAPAALARSLNAHAPEGRTPRITAFGRGRTGAPQPDDPANVPRDPASTG